MLKRKIEETLAKWKSTKTYQGILVTGARQVGKTFSIDSFTKANYRQTIKIDFVENPRAVDIIGGAESLDDLLLRITALADAPLVPGETALFFDEVQRCADSITWMRYLGQDDRFDVIYSGSLLGVESYNYRSLPVGTLDVVRMFPLDFEEFCWASNIQPDVWNIIADRFARREAVPDYLHDKLTTLFLRYVLVGGMPEAVSVYAETHDTQALRERQKSILSAYRADITRYVGSREHAQRIKTIYDAVPAQLNKENRRFFMSGMDKRARYRELQPDFDWLENAGVVIPVTRVTEAVYPLGISRKDSFFKLYMNDVGLLFSSFPSADVDAIILNEASVNLGLVFENAVAQELFAHGHEHLYYYNTAKVGEVDFLIEKPASIDVVPCEVKSGNYSRKHKALDNFLDEKPYRSYDAVVLHKGNVSVEGRVAYLPLYMVAFL